MIYIGIDPGLAPTIALMDSQKRIKFVTVPVTRPPKSIKTKWLQERYMLLAMRKKLFDFTDKYVEGKSCVVGLESLAFGKQFRVAMMAKIEYTIQNVLLAHVPEWRFYMVAPSTMKLVVGGHGRSTKEEVALSLRAMFTFRKSASENETDALGILVVARRNHQLTQEA